MSYIQNIELMSSKDSKFITSYSFDVSNSKVTIKESFDVVLYVVNVTTGDVIYNPLQKGRGGVVEGNLLTFVFPTSGMISSDSLLIVVSEVLHSTKESDLNTIKELTKETNKILNKIYK